MAFKKDGLDRGDPPGEAALWKHKDKFRDFKS